VCQESHPVVAWFVGAQVVEDYMDIPFGRHIFDDLIHEVEEPAPPSSFCVYERHIPLDDIEGG
jgi:hypothetical protein